MSCSSEFSSDYVSVTEGPSVRNLRWSRDFRRRVCRAWPPTNSVSYPIWKRHTIYRHLVEHIGADTVSGAGMRPEAEHDELDTPEDRLVRDRWRELADQKIKVYAIRSRIKETSAEINKKREDRDEAEHKFMSAARPVLTPVLPSAQGALQMSNLQNLFQDMQEKRETCRGHELSMETLEKELKHAQDGLDLLQRRLINELRNPIEAGATREPLKLGIPPLPQSDLLLCLEMEPAKIRRYAEWNTLMHIVLEFNTAKQKRVELFEEREKIEERRSSYRFFEQNHPAALRYITPLQDRELKFLGDFYVEKCSVLNTVRHLHKNVREHVQICCEMNIIPRYISLSEAQSWFPGDFSIDEDLKDLSETAAEWTENTTSTKTTQFSILLSNPSSHLLRQDFPQTAKAVLREARAALKTTKDSSPEHSQIQAVVGSAAKEVSIQNLLSDAKEGNKPDFINRWMLQTLCTSIHETETLYSQYLNEGPTGVLDPDEWQESVLRNWYDDGDDKTARSLQSKISETTWETAPPAAPSWLSDPFSDSYLWCGSNDEEEPMETEMFGALEMSEPAAANSNDITLEMR